MSSNLSSILSKRLKQQVQDKVAYQKTMGIVAAHEPVPYSTSSGESDDSSDRISESASSTENLQKFIKVKHGNSNTAVLQDAKTQTNIEL